MKKSDIHCLECGHTFQRAIGRSTFEIKCPKCGGYDTEVAFGASFRRKKNERDLI